MIQEMLKDKFNKNTKLDKMKNIEDQWRNIRNSIHNTVEKMLGYKKRIPKKKCITSEIFNMMEERRLAKGNIQKIQ
jgi:hypothetical protein